MCLFIIVYELLSSFDKIDLSCILFDLYYSDIIPCLIFFIFIFIFHLLNLSLILFLFFPHFYFIKSFILFYLSCNKNFHFHKDNLIDKWDIRIIMSYTTVFRYVLFSSTVVCKWEKILSANKIFFGVHFFPLLSNFALWNFAISCMSLLSISVKCYQFYSYCIFTVFAIIYWF